MNGMQPAVDRLAAMDASAVARPDVQAWVLLGLRAAERPEAEAHASRLARFQMPDGSLPVRRETPQAHWPTGLAALAWTGLDADCRGRARRAADFLVGVTGKHFPKPDGLGHDTSIVGWSWISETHSWVEPSALAMLAIDRAGVSPELHTEAGRRVDSAVAMILDRQIAGGGWNYGNTQVLGATLKPLPEETAFALCGLHGHADAAAVADSVAYLRSELPLVRSPATLAWTLMALRLWGRPVDEERPVRECLAIQEAIGPYPPDMLAQLIVSVRRPSLVLGETADPQDDGVR